MKSDETLREAAFHLMYEIGMFYETARRLSSCEDVALYNALLESFLIHTRNLLFFFYDEADREDDIVAGQFVAGWAGIRAWRSTLLRRAGEEANKKVTHLTYRRLNDSYSWDVDAIRREIGAVALCFCEAVADEKVTEDFKPYVRAMVAGGGEKS